RQPADSSARPPSFRIPVSFRPENPRRPILVLRQAERSAFTLRDENSARAAQSGETGRTSKSRGILAAPKRRGVAATGTLALRKRRHKLSLELIDRRAHKHD